MISDRSRSVISESSPSMISEIGIPIFSDIDPSVISERFLIFRKPKKDVSTTSEYYYFGILIYCFVSLRRYGELSETRPLIPETNLEKHI